MRRANIVLTVIPDGLTNILQTLDISINRSFKAKLRKFWEEWMFSGNHTFTKTGRQRRVDYVTKLNGFLKLGTLSQHRQ